MTAFYNEWNPEAAAWLRELIDMGLIAHGVVDERSITEIHPDELVGFSQLHFFAGIGGWSRALRLAGWPDDKPVVTASLPCQPFSAAGKQLGKDDERHLLPHFLELVKACKPSVIFGEQVDKALVNPEGAVAKAYRRAEPGTKEPPYCWASDLQTNMETQGYDVGFHILGAHSAGSFHQRQRIYWVANANHIERREQCNINGGFGSWSWNKSGGRSGINGGISYANSKRQSRPWQVGRSSNSATNGDREINRAFDAGNRHDWRKDNWLQHVTGKRCRKARNASNRQPEWFSLRCPISIMAYTQLCRRERQSVEQSTRLLNAMDATGQSREPTSPYSASFGGMGNTKSPKCQHSSPAWTRRTGITGTRSVSTVGNTKHNGRIALPITASNVQTSAKRRQDGADVSGQPSGTSRPDYATSLSGCQDGRGMWDNPDWIWCRDGKYRPIHRDIKPLVRTIKSSSKPLANGLSGGVGYSGDTGAYEDIGSQEIDFNNSQEARKPRLIGYGNAIVPQVAALFIRAFMNVTKM